MILALADRYIAARVEASELRRQAKEAGARVRQLERELVEAMADQHVRNFALENGVAIALRRQFKVSVTRANEDQVREWLQERTGDYMPFTRETLQKKPIEELCRSIVEEEGPEAIPACLRLFTMDGVTVRGLRALEENDDDGE